MTILKNILVTGGAGYIGSHVCKLLQNNGMNPITFDNLSQGVRSAVKWGPLVCGDIRDEALLISTFEKYRPEAVIHFAAHAYVGESVEEPHKYYNNNVYGSMCLLNAALKANVKNIIFSSTCATYGEPESIPISEIHPQNPINPYGRTKFIVEKMIENYAHAYEFNFVNLRYFNAAGADPEIETGEFHIPETHLIPLCIRAALDPKFTLSVFGADYDTEDGSAIRDYVHVSDLACAHFEALIYLLNGNKSRSFNIGSGSGFSVFEIIKKVDEVTALTTKYEVVPRRNGDPAVLVSDSSDARKILKWNPSLSDLDTIIKTATHWEENLMMKNYEI